jgi:hypothetical protein
VAEPPYTSWSKTKSTVTRLDGPVLFPYDGQIFAVARFQPGARGYLTRLGSVFSRKRTSLFRIEPESITWLSDLPSAGMRRMPAPCCARLPVDEYYTSRPDRDYPWLLGMFLPTDLWMARVPLAALAAAKPARD